MSTKDCPKCGREMHPIRLPFRVSPFTSGWGCLCGHSEGLERLSTKPSFVLRLLKLVPSVSVVKWRWHLRLVKFHLPVVSWLARPTLYTEVVKETPKKPEEKPKTAPAKVEPKPRYETRRRGWKHTKGFKLGGRTGPANRKVRTVKLPLPMPKVLLILLTVALPALFLHMGHQYVSMLYGLPSPGAFSLLAFFRSNKRCALCKGPVSITQDSNSLTVVKGKSLRFCSKSHEEIFSDKHKRAEYNAIQRQTRRDFVKVTAGVAGAGVLAGLLGGIGIGRSEAASGGSGDPEVISSGPGGQVGTASVIVFQDSSGNNYAIDRGAGLSSTKGLVGALLVNANVTTTYYNTLTGNASGATTTTAGMQETINCGVSLSSGLSVYITGPLHPSSNIDLKGIKWLRIVGSGQAYQTGSGASNPDFTSSASIQLSNSFPANTTLFVNSSADVSNLMVEHLFMWGNPSNVTGANSIDFKAISVGSPGQMGLLDVVIQGFNGSALFESSPSTITQVNLSHVSIVNCGIGIGDSSQGTILTGPSLIGETFFWNCGTPFSINYIDFGTKVFVTTFENTNPSKINAILYSKVEINSVHDPAVLQFGTTTSLGGSVGGAAIVGSDVTFIVYNGGSTTSSNVLIHHSAGNIEGSTVKMLFFSSFAPSAGYTTLFKSDNAFQGSTLAIYDIEGGGYSLNALDLTSNSGNNASKIVGGLHNTVAYTNIIKAPSAGYQGLDIDIQGYNPQTNLTLATNPPVTGTTYQNTFPFPIKVAIPITLNPTSAAAATAYLRVGSSSTAGANAIKDQVNFPAGLTTVDGAIYTLKYDIPLGYYYEVDVTNATIGTAQADEAE